MKFKLLLISIVSSVLVFGQVYTVGDYVDDFSGDICHNGEGTWSYEEDGRDRVVWINLFTSWWPSCTTEAPQAEAVYQQYTNDSLVYVAFGSDWNQPYSCTSWGTTFGLSHPIIDDINNIYGLFGIGYIPHNLIIGGDGELLYSDSGYNQAAIIAIINQALEDLPSDLDEDGFDFDEDNCPETYNPAQSDIDEDGSGDACDICDNANVFVVGNVNGDLDDNNNPIIDFFDVVSLLDHLQTDEANETPISECRQQAANINYDNNVNIIDVVNLVNMILFDNIPTAFNSNEDDGKVSLIQTQSNDQIILESSSDIGGFQINISTLNDIDQYLDDIILPRGWSMTYSSSNNNYKLYAYDATGNNSINSIDLMMPVKSILDVNNIIIASKDGHQIKTTLEKNSYQGEAIALPNVPNIQSLYPNPFNPLLTISYSIPSETMVSITVFNMLGEKISTLVNNAYTLSGFHSVNWNASDYPSGMYFVKIQTPSVINTKKALLLK